jgi:hypothetical protein
MTTQFDGSSGGWRQQFEQPPAGGGADAGNVNLGLASDRLVSGSAAGGNADLMTSSAEFSRSPVHARRRSVDVTPSNHVTQVIRRGLH